MSDWSSGYVTDIGYTYGFYRELTPVILDLVPLILGRRGPNANDRLAYCELGCGQGLSANLLAAANPHIDFYATDFNPAHIAEARALARAAGTPNVQFYEDSFAEFLDRPGLPEFDIIALHGIYSWIAPEHRRTIVEIARKRLKPGGLLYNSYNALPGWANAAPMRHLMYMHGRIQGGPTAGRLEPALAFIDRLIGVNAGYFRANPALKERFGKLKTMQRNYLAHEYMNDAWTLLYHSDVAAEMAGAKLSYLGSAHLTDNIDGVNLTSDQMAMLADVADSTLRETVRDYLTGTQFRRDVFIKGTSPLSAAESQNIWAARRFALSVRRQNVTSKVHTSLGEVQLQDEVYKPVLDAFADGAKQVSELIALPEIAALGWAKLTQALTLLAGMGQLQPCLAAGGQGERQKRTRAFNAAVQARAEFSQDIAFLASPLTGGGETVDRIQQLFLSALKSKTDPAEFAQAVLARQGQRLMKDGQVIVDAGENLKELRNRYQTFSEKRLPVLQHLGIV